MWVEIRTLSLLKPGLCLVCGSKGSSCLCCEKHVESGSSAQKMTANLWSPAAPVLRHGKVTWCCLLAMPHQDKSQSAGVEVL